MHRRGALCRKSVDGGRDTGWTNRPSLIRYKFTCNNISVSPDEPPRFLSRLTNVSFRFFFISRFDDIVIVVKYYYFYYYRSICGSGIFVFVQRSFPFWILSFWSHPSLARRQKKRYIAVENRRSEFSKVTFWGESGYPVYRMIMGRIVWFVSH